MLEHVDDVSGRITEEESANAPLLVGQRVDDLEPGGLGGRVCGVDVLDLEGGDRMHDAVASSVIRLNWATSPEPSVTIQPWSISTSRPRVCR